MVNLQNFNNILVIEDRKSRRIVSLEDDVYSIGRDLNNSIVIYEDRRVSRHHATLLRKKNPNTNDYSYWIIDGDLQGNRSTNGILVNGRTRLSHELKHGDQIVFGGEAKANYYEVNDEISSLKLLEAQKQETPEILERNTSVLEIDVPENAGVDRKLARLGQEELLRLASFPELSPNPIIEISLTGEIIYLNTAAAIAFDKIEQLKLEHPILSGLICETKNRNGTLFVREVKIGEEIFEQYIHYLPDGGSIRIYVYDFTERKQIEAQLRESEERYRAVVRQSLEGIFLVDIATKKFIEANKAYCNLLGYTPEEIQELTLYEVVALEREEVDSHIDRLLKEKHPQESLHRNKDGININVEVNVSPIRYAKKDVFCFSVRDISERKRTERILQHQAFYDILTGLPNGTLFKEQLFTALANAKRNQRLMAVMLLDIDRFKEVNENWGHLIGDRLLKSFADRLRTFLRQGDTVARWGSDEFIVLLPQVSSPEEAARIGQRILDILNPAFEMENQEIHVRSNIGVALFPQDGDDADALLKNADAALYRAKEQGRNGYSFYKPTMTAKVDLLLRRESILHQALEREEFFLDYQPQINVKSGEIFGMEALLRWQHPQLGLVLPGEFITLAEETGSILQIGEWVLHTACHQSKSWQSSGLTRLKMAINISSQQFHQPSLVSMVANILEKTRLEPDLLVLEITENTIVENSETASKILTQWQEMGIKISIDDFGSGYSSLGYLRKFPFHSIKIDRSLVQNLRNEARDLAMISAMIAWGRGLNLEVIAEGVETKQQLEILQGLQCEEMQGYWFSQPLSAKEATRFLSWHGNSEDRTDES